MYISLFLSAVSVLVSAPALLPPLSHMLENVLQADQQLMERTKAKLFSALISALHIQGLNGESMSLHSPVLPHVLSSVIVGFWDQISPEKLAAGLLF